MESHRRRSWIYTTHRDIGRAPAFLSKNALRGRRYILVDNWGPYDFQRPVLWPRGEGTYEILGPKGKWRMVSAEGATLSASSGTVPGEVQLSVQPGRVGTTKVELEFVGEQTRDNRGVVTPKSKPVRFGFSRFFAPIAWEVKFYRWSKPENPSEVHSNPDARHFDELVASATPIKTEKRDRLDYAGSSFGDGIPNDHFLTIAEGNFTVPPGKYVLNVTTDDGCRMWLDGTLILADAWKYQGPTAYPIPVTLGGSHKLRVEHFQIDGYAMLKVDLRPGS